MIKSKIAGSAFRSDYGFSSPNFSVDANGNIIASSLITSDLGEPDSGNLESDFTVTDDESGVIFVQPLEGINPSFTIAKTQRIRLSIDLDIVDLFFLRENKEDLLISGLRHSSGTAGEDAQGQDSGTYTINLPADFSDKFIYYTDRERSFFGEITVVDPVGVFSSVSVTGTTSAENSTTGALTVAGGLGVAESIVTPTLNVRDIFSTENINIISEGPISFFGSDSSSIGVIDNEGSTIAVTNTEINNTSIGLTTPATANFTSAQVNSSPVTGNDITNKAYVDSRDIAFSIAFGL